MGLTLISLIADSQETEDRGRRGRGALIIRAVGEGTCRLAWQKGAGTVAAVRKLPRE